MAPEPKAFATNRERERRIAAEAVRLYVEMPPRPTQVTQTQAAEILGVDRKTIYNYIRAGKLKLNRGGFLSITDVDALLSSE